MGIDSFERRDIKYKHCNMSMLCKVVSSNYVSFTLILQFLTVMSVVTNCALLVWLYDQERKWSIEPGLAAILIMEHALLLFKFAFPHLVPEVISLFNYHFT